MKNSTRPFRLDELRDLADLAGLEMPEDDRESELLLQQMGAILGYMRLLDEVQTSPEQSHRPPNHTDSGTRADVIGPCLPREVALGAAPAVQGEFFVVPQIWDGGEGEGP